MLTAFVFIVLTQPSDAGLSVAQLRAQASALGPNRKTIAKLIGQRTEPWARQLAAGFLASPDPVVRSGRLEAFALRAPDAKELEQLRRVAACDPWGSVRNEARALLGDAGTALPSCPEPRWTFVDAEVATLGKRSVKLSTATNFTPAEVCKGMGLFAGRCIHGEAGIGHDGRLWWGKTVVADDPLLYPLLMNHWKQDAVLMSGNSGPGPLVSGVALLRPVGGGVQFQWLANFEGSIDRYAVDGDQFFFSVRSVENSPCENAKGADVLYVLERDGGYSVGRSDATECLWSPR
ncbi:MAG: hypothetical protein JNM17_06320 [Archangium sp.]|nr:hypothetical protein [Archangium sp.]